MGIIFDILKDIPLSAVLKEKIIKLESDMSILETENSVLKSENGKLIIQIKQLQNKIQTLEEIKEIRDKYIHNITTGTSISKESGHHFCTSCLNKNIESPLTVKQNGWQCELNDCNKFYSNPSYCPPQLKPNDPFDNL